MTVPSSHRIDPPATAPPVGRRRSVHRARGAVTSQAASTTASQRQRPAPDQPPAPNPFPAPDPLPAPDPSPVPDPQDWLRLHGDELINRLQRWAEELDAREAQLNARLSLQDNRERQFRLKSQNSLAEQAEQRRAIARLRKEIEARARRLAFRDD